MGTLAAGCGNGVGEGCLSGQHEHYLLDLLAGDRGLTLGETAGYVGEPWRQGLRDLSGTTVIGGCDGHHHLPARRNGGCGEGPGGGRRGAEGQPKLGEIVVLHIHQSGRYTPGQLVSGRCSNVRFCRRPRPFGIFPGQLVIVEPQLLQVCEAAPVPPGSGPSTHYSGAPAWRCGPLALVVTPCHWPTGASVNQLALLVQLAPPVAL